MVSKWTPLEHYTLYRYFLKSPQISKHLPDLTDHLPGRNYSAIERKWIRIMNNPQDREIVRQDYEQYLSVNPEPDLKEWAEEKILELTRQFTEFNDKLDSALPSAKGGNLSEIKRLSKEVETLKKQLSDQTERITVLRTIIAGMKERGPAPKRNFFDI